MIDILVTLRVITKTDPVPIDERTERRIYPRPGQVYKDPERMGMDVNKDTGDLVIYSLDRLEDAKITLETMVGETLPKAKAPSVGRWRSPSHFLGAKLTGDYYVKSLVATPSREASWNSLKPPENPLAFCLDSGLSDPFLVLRGLDPMKVKVKDSGSGLLHRAPLGTGAVQKQEISWLVTSVNPKAPGKSGP